MTIDLSPLDVLLIERALCKVSNGVCSTINFSVSRKGEKYKMVKHEYKKALERRFHEAADEMRNRYNFDKIR